MSLVTRSSLLSVLTTLLLTLFLSASPAWSDTFKLELAPLIGHVFAICPDCKDEAAAYNALADAINALNKTISQAKAGVNSLDQQILDLRKTAAAGKKAKLAELKAARKKAMQNLNTLGNQLSRKTRALQIAKRQFEHCQKATCKTSRTVQTVDRTTLQLLTPSKCRPCQKIAREYNAIVRRIGREQHLQHELRRQQRRLNNNYADRQQRRAIDKKLQTHRSNIIRLGKQLPELYKAYQDCFRKHCSKERSALPSTRGYNNTLLAGGFSLGVAGHVSISDKQASFDHLNDSGEQQTDSAGIGGGILVQYGFAANPRWFVYSGLFYPGDHDQDVIDQMISDSSSPLVTHLTNHFVFTLGAGYTLLIRPNVSLSIGGGLGVVDRTLSTTLPTELGAYEGEQTDTSVVPQVLLEALIPLGQSNSLLPGAAILLGLSVSYVPEIAMDVPSSAGDFHFKVDSSIKTAFLFGFKFSLANV